MLKSFPRSICSSQLSRGRMITGSQYMLMKLQTITAAEKHLYRVNLCSNHLSIKRKSWSPGHSSTSMRRTITMQGLTLTAIPLQRNAPKWKLLMDRQIMDNGPTAKAGFVHVTFYYSKTCLISSGHSKRQPKLVFKTDYRLMQAKVLQNALQYFWPSLSYHLSLRSLFCLFLSGRLRQVLLYNASSRDVSLNHLPHPLIVWFHLHWLNDQIINHSLGLCQ